MKKVLLVLALSMAPVLANSTDYNSSDMLYGWNGSAQFWQTWADHKAQLEAELSFDVGPGANENYVTDAQLAIIENTSGSNTGDQDLSGFVETTGNETIAGVKTFSSSPIVPTPTTANQAANRQYVLDNAGSGGGASEINDLTDVDTTGKALGKLLKFDAGGNLIVGDDLSGGGGGLTSDPTAASQIIVSNGAADYSWYDFKDSLEAVPSTFEDRLDWSGMHLTLHTDFTLDAEVQGLIENLTDLDLSNVNVTLHSDNTTDDEIVSANTNALEWHFNSDLLGASATVPDEGMTFRIPVGVDYDTVWIDCDGTTTSLAFDVSFSATRYGVYTDESTPITTIGSEVDVSGYGSLTAGQYINMRVSTASAGDSTQCDVSLILMSN